MSQQTEAQMLADWLEAAATAEDMGREPDPRSRQRKAAAELRRLDAAVGEIGKALQWERQKNRELLEALHHISLCSQNSMSSQRECGQIARAAIAKHGGNHA